MRRFLAVWLPVLLVGSVVLGCASCGGRQRSEFILATTTSVQDSGILDLFTERFEAEHPYDIKPVAVGSGAALFMGSNGDASVILTHEPKAEADFMAAGNAQSQDKVMHNDFILVGPASDPAEVNDAKDAAEAMTRIAESGSTFISRGDASGTHAMEMSIWERAGIQPEGDWYLESGLTMGQCLRMADEKNAYTLTDRATFIVMEEALRLEMLLEGDPTLLNQYTVTVVNPEKFDSVNNAGAKAFRSFLLREETRELIRDYGWEEYHQRLFYPD